MPPAVRRAAIPDARPLVRRATASQLRGPPMTGRRASPRGGRPTRWKLSRVATHPRCATSRPSEPRPSCRAPFPHRDVRMRRRRASSSAHRGARCGRSRPRDRHRTARRARRPRSTMTTASRARLHGTSCTPPRAARTTSRASRASRCDAPRTSRRPPQWRDVRRRAHPCVNRHSPELTMRRTDPTLRHDRRVGTRVVHGTCMLHGQDVRDARDPVPHVDGANPTNHPARGAGSCVPHRCPFHPPPWSRTCRRTRTPVTASRRAT